MLKYRILVAAGALAGFGALAHAAANDPVAPPPQKVVAQATIPWMERSPGIVTAVAWDSSNPTEGIVGVRIKVTDSIIGDTKVALMSGTTGRAMAAFPTNLTQAMLKASGAASYALLAGDTNPLTPALTPSGWQDVFFKVSALRAAGISMVSGGSVPSLSVGLPLYKAATPPSIETGYWFVWSPPTP